MSSYSSSSSNLTKPDITCFSRSSSERLSKSYMYDVLLSFSWDGCGAFFLFVCETFFPVTQLFSVVEDVSNTSNVQKLDVHFLQVLFRLVVPSFERLSNTCVEPPQVTQIKPFSYASSALSS